MRSLALFATAVLCLIGAHRMRNHSWVFFHLTDDQKIIHGLKCDWCEYSPTWDR